MTPLPANVPPEVERLDAAIDRLLPKVRITRLLAEVARRTGFVERFTELRSGKIHPNPEAVLAAILAEGTNLGLERMGRQQPGRHLRPTRLDEGLVPLGGDLRRRARLHSRRPGRPPAQPRLGRRHHLQLGRPVLPKR